MEIKKASYADRNSRLRDFERRDVKDSNMEERLILGRIKWYEDASEHRGCWRKLFGNCVNAHFHTINSFFGVIHEYPANLKQWIDCRSLDSPFRRKNIPFYRESYRVNSTRVFFALQRTDNKIARDVEAISNENGIPTIMCEKRTHIFALRELYQVPYNFNNCEWFA